MAKTFEQFHFSLLEREQPDLLEPKLDRDGWLRKIFLERFVFSHHGKQFWWVPQDVSDEYIVGVIEREKFQLERTPPDDGAKEIDRKFWAGAMVIIDPRNRPGGQAVAVENNANVGQPSALLTSLVTNVNGNLANQYTLIFKALFKGGSFWRFAEKHGGQLEYVKFRFTVPNMIFGLGGGVKKGLRRIGEDTDAQEIEVKIESEEGIRADSEAVKEGMAYGEEGNATVTAKALNGDRWSSTKQKLSIKMQSILNFSDAKTKDVQEWLKQALDREADSVDNLPDNPNGDDRVD
jgi:hypothetical protein